MFLYLKYLLNAADLKKCKFKIFNMGADFTQNFMSNPKLNLIKLIVLSELSRNLSRFCSMKFWIKFSQKYWHFKTNKYSCTVLVTVKMTNSFYCLLGHNRVKKKTTWKYLWSSGFVCKTFNSKKSHVPYTYSRTTTMSKTNVWMTCKCWNLKHIKKC